MVRTLSILLAALLLAPAAQAEPASFEPVDCWFERPRDRDMTCGWLSVPENRRRADGRHIKLAVVIFEPDKERREPLVYLTGGPGQPAYIETPRDIDSWWSFIDREPWLRGRRVVVPDQRGVGLSEPRLDCPGFYDPYSWTGVVDSPDQRPPEGTREQAIEACRDLLIGQGIDLAAYNTKEGAADIADLRRALGVDGWVVFGISYGTRVVLEVLRSNPEGVVAAVLDSVLPPEVDFIGESALSLQTALQRLFADCAADQPCRSTFGDLEPLVSETVRRLNAAPLPLRLTEPDEPARFLSFDGSAFLWIIFDSLYDWDRIERLPFLILRTAQQDYRYLAREARGAFLERLGGDFADGVQMSVGCNEEFPFYAAQPLPASHPLLAGWVETDFYLWACPLWPAGKADPQANEAVSSDIPVLLLAGDYDPITPVDWARRAAQRLSKGQVLVFRGIGHDVVDSTDCGGKAVADFLDNPTQRVQTPCVREMEAPYFIVEESQW